MNKEEVVTNLKKGARVAYNHKFKIILLSLLCYSAKKGYDLYRHYKPMLDAVRSLKGISSAEAEQSESAKKLQLQLSLQPSTKKQIKIFGTSYKTIQQTLRRQPDYLHSLIEEHYQLEKIKQSTIEHGISSQLKQERWQELKRVLFEELFAQLYTTRLVNMVSILQFNLTGKRFFKASLQKEVEESQMEISDEEHTEELQQEVNKVQEACEQFMSLSFTNMLKNTIEEYMYPLVTEVVSRELNEINLRSQMSVPDIESLMDKIHDKIIANLFKIDPKQTTDTTDLEDSTEVDSLDEELPQCIKQIWLTERINEMYTANQDHFNKNPIMQELVDEFLDFMEADYFQSAMFEMIEFSYQNDLKGFVVKQLQQDEMYKETERVALPKLITFIYRLQNQNELIKKLRDPLSKGVNEQIEKLIKLVYFEEEVYQEISVVDLVEYREASGGFLENLDISSLLGMLQQ